MALVKAMIIPLDEKGKHVGEPVPALFNPAEYSIEKSNQFQSTVLPGLSTPITHFISGANQSLTMDLFFDTYELRLDVRLHTAKLTSLLDINSELHAPPICLFVWGTVVFKAVLERVNQKFTMFLDSGIPVRATLNVTFKEYKNISEQFQESPRHSADRTKKRVIKQGENLWMIADSVYGDPGLWRHIALANNIDNPKILEVGKEIIVPPLE